MLVDDDDFDLNQNSVTGAKCMCSQSNWIRTSFSYVGPSWTKDFRHLIYITWLKFVKS